MRRWGFLCVTAATLVLYGKASDAGSVHISAGGMFSVPVVSYQQRAFATVIRQGRDYSCGSAAVASLLTYHYGVPTTEADAFLAMWKIGDQARIREVGFSLLDIKLFLESRGFRADGFRIPLDTLARIGIPAIALIETKGYRHFVLVKGLAGDLVLVGDPALGIRTYTRETFEAMRLDDVVLVIRSNIEQGRETFNRLEEWRLRRATAPLALGIDRRGFDAHGHLARIPAQPFPMR